MIFPTKNHGFTPQTPGKRLLASSTAEATWSQQRSARRSVEDEVEEKTGARPGGACFELGKDGKIKQFKHSSYMFIWEKYWKNIGKIWENIGKILEKYWKRWEKYWKNIGKDGKNMGNITHIDWENKTSISTRCQ